MEEYKSIIFLTTSENTDLASYALLECGAEGVSIIDEADLKSLPSLGITFDYVDKSYLDNLNGKAQVTGYFLGAGNAEQLLSDIKIYLNDLGVDFDNLIIADGQKIDWVTEWKKYYKPIEVGEFLIVPEWEKGKITTDKTQIYINPGTAFGTGQHETTKLCLEFLSGQNVQNKMVSDIGAGSGILGIASLLKGASRCGFYDIDPLSLDAIALNLAENAYSAEDCRATIENAEQAEFEDGYADIILANITANVLLMYLEIFKKHIKPDGKLIISGIIKDRSKEIKTAYSDAGFDIIAEKTDADWVAYMLQLK